MPAVGAAGILIAVGAFAATPRAAIPTAGILIGGAMTARTLTGRRLLEGLADDGDLIEARLSLGDRIRTALAPTVRQAIKTGLVPAIDQTRNVGIVTLPGTFVGLVLGGASPAEAARIQLTVLLTLLAVELLAATAIAELIVRTRIAPGERLREDVVAMFDGDFDRDAERLTSKLDGFADDPDGLRDAFLHRHVHALYAKLTDAGETGLRADDLVYAAAELVPGLTPSREQVERERERLL